MFQVKLCGSLWSIMQRSPSRRSPRLQSTGNENLSGSLPAGTKSLQQQITPPAVGVPVSSSAAGTKNMPQNTTSAAGVPAKIMPQNSSSAANVPSGSNVTGQKIVQQMTPSAAGVSASSLPAGTKSVEQLTPSAAGVPFFACRYHRCCYNVCHYTRHCCYNHHYCCPSKYIDA